MDGRKVRVCGIQAKFGDGKEQLAVTFQIERRDAAAEFTVEALPVNSANAFSSMQILQQSEQPLIFANSAPSETGGWKLRMPANDSAVTQFIQELMLQGTRIEVKASVRAEPRHFKIEGPLAQSVRAGYLNCVGDLYLPGE
jgi:hypothetical protein